VYKSQVLMVRWIIGGHPYFRKPPYGHICPTWQMGSAIPCPELYMEYPHWSLWDYQGYIYIYIFADSKPPTKWDARPSML
jgi:hypothetical protein